jgi:hypothetical protein
MYLSESFPHLTPCVLSFSYKGLVAWDRYLCLKAYKTKLERRALKISLFSLKTKFLLASQKIFLQNPFKNPLINLKGAILNLKHLQKPPLRCPWRILQFYNNKQPNNFLSPTTCNLDPFIRPKRDPKKGKREECNPLSLIFLCRSGLSCWH